MFEDRVLKRIFGSVRQMVRGKWRKLRNEELHSLCSSESTHGTCDMRGMHGKYEKL
jgi:hypothetical protein